VILGDGNNVFGGYAANGNVLKLFYCLNV